MTILIDNGHGSGTPGKRSPGGELLEWEFNRAVAGRVRSLLAAKGVDARLLVPEDRDVPLDRGTDSRVARANRLHSASPCLLVSVHADAQGDGTKWGPARGLTALVDPAASDKARDLARWITDAARSAGLLGNRAVGACGYRTAAAPRLAMLRRTKCPAVLVECGFMDNRDDCAMMATGQGRDRIAAAIAEGVWKSIS